MRNKHKIRAFRSKNYDVVLFQCADKPMPIVPTSRRKFVKFGNNRRILTWMTHFDMKNTTKLDQTISSNFLPRGRDVRIISVLTMRCFQTDLSALPNLSTKILYPARGNELTAAPFIPSKIKQLRAGWRSLCRSWDGIPTVGGGDDSESRNIPIYTQHHLVHRPRRRQFRQIGPNIIFKKSNGNIRNFPRVSIPISIRVCQLRNGGVISNSPWV